MDLNIRDKQAIWHPFTQEKLAPPRLVIERAEGAYLYTQDGRKIFDGISSWWVNLHGHCHPYIAQAVGDQAKNLEQVIFADCTHEKAITLSERLLKLLPPHFSKVFFSDNGSTAVEVALKLAIQSSSLKGQKKTKILALQNGYHGDTFGAMSVGARIGLTSHFDSLMWNDVIFIDPPYRNASEAYSLEHVAQILDAHRDIAAFIFEPIIQGAGGMLMHDIDLLDDLIGLVKERGILCIADEVMTGFGRTGKIFATDYLKNKPDIICLAKGLTGGMLPLSVTVCSKDLYDSFLSDRKQDAFLHGHSFSGNALGCAAALASLDLLEAPESLSSIERISTLHRNFIHELSTHKKAQIFIKDVRHQGTILALEFCDQAGTSYFSSLRDRMATFFLERNLLLRPLGQVLYVIPPYVSSDRDLKSVYEAMIEWLEEM